MPYDRPGRWWHRNPVRPLSGPAEEEAGPDCYRREQKERRRFPFLIFFHAVATLAAALPSLAGGSGEDERSLHLGVMKKKA